MYPRKLDFTSHKLLLKPVSQSKQNLHFASLRTCPSFICPLNPHLRPTVELCRHLLFRKKNCKKSSSALVVT